MQKMIFIALCVLFSIKGICQTTYFYAKGTVINAESKLPMQGASVFAENTTLGTVLIKMGNLFWLCQMEVTI